MNNKESLFFLFDGLWKVKTKIVVLCLNALGKFWNARGTIVTQFWWPTIELVVTCLSNQFCGQNIARHHWFCAFSFLRKVSLFLCYYYYYYYYNMSEIKSITFQFNISIFELSEVTASTIKYTSILITVCKNWLRIF